MDNENRGEKKQIVKRTVKYLNNIVEQDHRFIKRRINPMLGFKSFDSAKNTLAGLEIIRMIQKDQVIDRNGMSNWEVFKSIVA